MAGLRRSQGTRMKSRYIFPLLIGFLFAAQVCFSQTGPAVLKVDPPSWWAGSSVNPIRLLIHGSNLSGARVQAMGSGFRIIGAPKTNERGTYLFVDIAIGPRAKPGARQLGIITTYGTAHASFEILPPLNRGRSFKGFSPA